MSKYILNFDEPITAELAKKVLKSPLLTMDLVHSYSFFFIDKNKPLYIDYIKKSVAERKNLYNAVEMASILSFTSRSILRIVQESLKSSKSTMLKLSCLDYLLQVKRKITRNNYIKLNTIAKLHTGVTLVIWQASLNLIIVNEEVAANLEQLQRLVTENYDPAYYYRLFSTLNDCKVKNSIKQRLLLITKTRLQGAKSVNKAQKKEFLMLFARYDIAGTNFEN